jgi:integrase/recombinase XerD
MTQGYSELEQVDRLIEACTNPRDRAFISTLGKTGMRISEATQLKESDIDHKRGTLTIIHLKERVKLKCPNCGEPLGKRHFFCPGCGKKVEQAIREKVEQRRQRVIPVDPDTLRLLDEYLKWRRKFPYKGPLVFPFSRQRGWQLIEKLGRRTGIKGLHPHSLRHLLATTWVAKGLDIKKLQILLGHASIATTMEYVDSNFEQLRSEYEKLWESKEDEEPSD